MWHFPKVRPKKVSKEISKGVTFGRASKHKTYFEGAFGLTFGMRGMFRRRFEGGFQRDGFRAGCRDTWHSPKDGPEGVSTEASKGHSAGLRVGSERCLGRASGHVSFSEKALKGSPGLACPERVFEGSFEGWSSGMTLIVGLGINGWDFSVRSD